MLVLSVVWSSRSLRSHLARAGSQVRASRTMWNPKSNETGIGLGPNDPGHRSGRQIQEHPDRPGTRPRTAASIPNTAPISALRLTNPTQPPLQTPASNYPNSAKNRPRAEQTHENRPMKQTPFLPAAPKANPATGVPRCLPVQTRPHVPCEAPRSSAPISRPFASSRRPAKNLFVFGPTWIERGV